MKLQELVSHHAGALNETDLAVWRYIESHPRECCYISIYDLASRCHVSRTSVLRFAKKLGLDGVVTAIRRHFPAFRLGAARPATPSLTGGTKNTLKATQIREIFLKTSKCLENTGERGRAQAG